MQCFLKDADTKQGADMRVRNWVSDIRNVTYDAEDLIDTYLLKVKNRHFIKRHASVFKKWKNSSEIEKDLEALQMRISDISVSRQTYGIKNVGEGTNHANEKLLKLRRSSPRGQYKDIIGLEKDVATLVTQLVKEEDQWHAISIVGMGGIGKTTLAKEVYNQVSVQSRFDCRAWIYVSQDFRTRDVLQDIIKQASKTRRNLRGLGEETLEEMLYEHLESKRYLVVLDDIWSTMAWDSLAKAFPNGGNGSRLLLTTRNTNVALHADPESFPHEMSFRSKDDSWKLFCKKTFIESIDRLCPPQLEEIGGEIVAKCAGLPLAIIVLGGLLSRKRRLSEWQRVLNTIRSQFARDPNGVSEILALSYYDLPYYLKFCFLYLGLFPEDYLISTRKLYRLWIAEGFIPQHGERMEEIAEDYLNELIDRNMVQVARMSANDRVKHRRWHDLLRDLSVSKSRLEQFFVFLGNLDSLPLAKARHHVVYTSSVQSLDDVSPNLRSLLFFKASDRNRGMNVSLDAFFLPCLSLISKSFRLIRVLDLEGMKLKELPSSIGELIHLKYLGLRDNRLERLPFEVGKLTNLQTLDIAENCFCNHHNIFWKMKNLRHLYINVRGGRKNSKIETLRNLQTLLDIGVEDWLATNPVKLITNLRKLGLRGNFRINRVEIFNSLAKLLCLQSLFLYTDENLVFPSLSQLSSLRRVIKLQMRGEIRKPPSPDEFPPNLTQLILHKSRFKDDPMEMLKKIPYLFVLRLKPFSCVGEKMKVSAGGFAQLEILELEYLELLEELDVEESALPKLKSFHISSCFRLTNISEGMKFVTTLQELEIKQMRKRFTDRLQGEDYYKVQHVPSIKIL